jgi:hypothetical protein
MGELEDHEPSSLSESLFHEEELGLMFLDLFVSAESGNGEVHKDREQEEQDERHEHNLESRGGLEASSLGSGVDDFVFIIDEQDVNVLE